MIGRRLGHYEVIEELGRGGMGVVYLARQDGLDRLVAVKVLAAVDAELAARLRREARVLSELHHPHIVSIYDVGEVSGSPYFVMAYCAGGSVADVLAQQGRLTVGQAVNVLASTSSALAAMHSLGLVHRDVKPSNVLLSADGQPFLSDLGIVGGGDRSRMTATGNLLGTIGYSAPELLDNAHHSPACDTFSLGVLGYEIVSGRHPFAGPSLSGVLDAVRRGVYPPLADVAPGVPTRLAELITSAMSLDPAQRPHDLDRLSHAFLTVAPPERVRVVQRDAPTQIRVAPPLVPPSPNPALESERYDVATQIRSALIGFDPRHNLSEPTRPHEAAPLNRQRRVNRELAAVVATVVLGVIAVVLVAVTKDDGSVTATSSPTMTLPANTEPPATALPAASTQPPTMTLPASTQPPATALPAASTQPPASGTRTDYPTGNNPFGIVFDGTDIWVTNIDDDTVSKMDRATGRRTDYSTGDNPLGIVFDFTSIWIINGGVDTVSKMDPATGTKTDYPTGGFSWGIAFDGTNIWITHRGLDTVSKMDPATGARTDYPTGSAPQGVVFDGASIWITNVAAGTVSKMDPATGARTDYPTGNSPSEIAFDGTNIWITNAGDNTVSKMDPATGTRTDYPTGNSPSGIAADYSDIWITNAGDNTVSKMDPATGTRTDFPTGTNPRGIAFDTTSIWIVNGGDNTVSRMVL